MLKIVGMFTISNGKMESYTAIYKDYNDNRYTIKKVCSNDWVFYGRDNTAEFSAISFSEAASKIEEFYEQWNKDKERL